MLLDWNEQIKAHLMWIWGLIFITKTNMSYRVHHVHSERQLIRFKENKNVFLPVEGYGITELRNDLEKSNQNIVFAYSQISDIYFLEKRWGTELKIKANIENKQKNYNFAIVKGWVKYTAKDPLQFHHVDWNPITLYKMS